MHLVSLLETPKNGDRVFHRGLRDEDGLEASLQGRILLDPLAKLVERRRPDAAELAPREGGLEEVGGVHRPFGRSGADDRVQLVDEQNDEPGGGFDLFEHGLQTIFELAAILRTRDEGPHVESAQSLVFQMIQGHRRARSAERSLRRSPSCRRQARR